MTFSYTNYPLEMAQNLGSITALRHSPYQSQANLQSQTKRIAVVQAQIDDLRDFAKKKPRTKVAKHSRALADALETKLEEILAIKPTTQPQEHKGDLS